MSKTKILGKKTFLLKFQKKDISKKYLSWLNDKSNLKYSNNRFTNHNFNILKKYYLSFDFKKNFLYKIFTSDGVFIGTITCYINPIHNHANIGILIGEKDYKGKGFGLDAWRSIIKYLFSKGVRKIYAGTMSCNNSMKKIFVKSGMRSEAKFKYHEKMNGRYYDMIYYSIFKKKNNK